MIQAPHRSRFVGQASVEYLVGCLLLFVLLAFDIGFDGSVVDYLIESIRTAFARFAAAISIP